jgi:hypothetical protein
MQLSNYNFRLSKLLQKLRLDALSHRFLLESFRNDKTIVDIRYRKESLKYGNPFDYAEGKTGELAFTHENQQIFIGQN